jgi:hypothetical protein
MIVAAALIAPEKVPTDPRATNVAALGPAVPMTTAPSPSLAATPQRPPAPSPAGPQLTPEDRMMALLSRGNDQLRHGKLQPPGFTTSAQPMQASHKRRFPTNSSAWAWSGCNLIVSWRDVGTIERRNSERQKPTDDWNDSVRSKLCRSQSRHLIVRRDQPSGLSRHDLADIGKRNCGQLLNHLSGHMLSKRFGFLIAIVFSVAANISYL